MGFILRFFFYFVKRIIWFLDLIVPKKKSLFVYGCLADRYYDNPRFFFEYMHSRHPEIKSVWLTRNKKICEKINQKLGQDSCKTIFSLKGVWTFLRARVAIISHGQIDFFYFLSSYSPKLIVNVWHGQPLKSIGYLSKKKEKIKIKERFDLFVVSSRIESHTMYSAFRKHVKETIITGQPRNDILLTNLAKNRQNELERFAKNIDLSFTPKHVILYAPTYRDNGSAKLFPFKDLDFEKLDQLMTENRAVLILRGHLNDLLRGDMQRDSLINKVINSKWCVILHQTKLPDINEIMHLVSLLITDYSGIYFDYLLVDRPMFFIPYDLEEYEKSNGFLYPYETVTPGPKIMTGKKFLEFLETFFQGKDQYSEKRKFIRDLFMEVQEPNSSEKIFSIIKSKIQL